MPTYEYKCPHGHLFEKFYPTMASKRRAACPQCGKRAEQLISGGGGLVFKGSGFYHTDSRSGAVSSESGATQGSAAGAAGKETAGKESSKSASGEGSSSGDSSGCRSSGRHLRIMIAKR